MAQQGLLFESSEPVVFVDGESGRIAYYPAALSTEEARALFEVVFREAPWSAQTMWMYDKMVDVPRRVARYDPDALPNELARAKALVERVTGERFTAVSCNYYRDHRDSVAWHNDHRNEMIERPTIVLLSLGATRPMLIRSKQLPRTAFTIDLEPGSLLVMAGRSKEFWEHAIPKLSRKTDPRISIAFRQSAATSPYPPPDSR